MQKKSTRVVLLVLCTNPWQIAVTVARMSVQLLMHIHEFHAWDAAPAQTLPLEHPPRGPIHGRGQPSIVSFVSASQARQTGGWRGSGWKAEPRRESGRGRLRHERRKLVCRHCIFVHTLKCRCLRSCKFTTTCKHGVFLFLTSGTLPILNHCCVCKPVNQHSQVSDCD